MPVTLHSGVESFALTGCMTCAHHRALLGAGCTQGRVELTGCDPMASCQPPTLDVPEAYACLLSFLLNSDVDC